MGATTLRITLLLVCLTSLRAMAQSGPNAYERRVIPAVRASAPPAIDGDLSDPAWRSAAKAETFIDRERGVVADDQTTVYILFDARCIYVAFDCRDSHPDQIVGRETLRDHLYQRNGDGGNNVAEDNVELLLDPFNTHRFDDFAQFSVNPIGTRSARITGGRANKAEWKGDWEAAARRTPTGWAAEMKIPWEILSYPPARDPVTLGINFSRLQQRTRIQSIWSNIGPQYFNELEGQWTGVQVPAFRPHLSLLPYLLPGFDRSTPTLRSGLDARYTLTPQLTAVASLNPDFGTIEGAVEGIAFSRSERFVPEHRPFFLEGEDYFGTYLQGPLFYSNRIETFDFGTKLYGKLTPADSIGLLHTLDLGNRSDLMAHYQHNFSDTVQGGVFVAQKSARDDNNTVGMLEQFARWGKAGLNLRWAGTSGTASGGSAGQLNLSYRDKLNFTFVGLYNVSPLFRVADGLTFFTDTRGVEVFHNWSASWRKGSWRDFKVFVNPQYSWHFDGRPFQRGISADFFLAARRDWGFGLNAGYSLFDDQIDNTYGFSFRQGISNRFRQWGIFFSTGRLGGAPSTFIGPGFSVRVLRSLDIIYSGGWQNLQGVSQQHVVTLNYELSPVRSLGGRLVAENGAVNAYLSYRNAGERGMETYFILGDPNAFRFRERVGVKFVFAL